MNNTTYRRNEALGFLAVMVLGMLCATAVSYSYSLSNFLHHDDGLWVGQALLGEPKAYTHPILHAAIVALSGSITLVKLIPMICYGLVASAIYLILREFSSRRMLPAVLALAILFYPVSILLTFYIVGSHPTLGIAFSLYSLYFFWLGWRAEAFRSYVLIALSGLFALGAALTSPMCPLVVFAPLLWLGVAVAAEGGSSRRWVNPRILVHGAILLIPSVVKIYQGLLVNYYSQAGQDRVDPSIEKVIPALKYAFGLIAKPLEAWPSLILAAAVLIAIVWAARRAVAVSTPHIDWRLPIMALLLSALVFAPNVSIGEEFHRDRYIFAPFIAGMVGVGVVLLQFLDKAGRPASTVITLLLLAVLITESVWSHYEIESRTRLQMTNYDAVVEAVERERDSWPEEAAILFVVESGMKTPSPWWSTPMVNYFAAKKKLYAMVAGEDQLRSSLVADQYVGGKRNPLAHSLQRYVSAEQGIGLKGDVPLYVYTREGLDHPFERASMTLVISPREALTVEHGQIPAQARRTPIDLFSETCEPIPGFVAFTAAAPRVEDEASLDLVEAPRGWSFDGSGADTLTLSAEPGELFALNLRIRTREPERIVRSRSPLPLFARSGPEKFRVDNRQELFSIEYSGSKGRWRSLWPYDDQVRTLDMSLYGRRGCRILLSLDGKMVSFLPNESLFTHWTLGGVHDRFWTGDIEEWRFYRTTR